MVSFSNIELIRLLSRESVPPKPSYPVVSLTRGRTYRLARIAASVCKGEWYYGVQCKGCQKNIYAFADQSGGTKVILWVGEGLVSIPCPFCGTDTTYEATKINNMQASENVTQRIAQPRVEPSNMPRQPLKRKYPKAKPTFGPGFLEDRPKAAALVARCIGLWTDVEIELARLLATMLGANTEPAAAVFLALRNSRAQSVVLSAAAKATLSDLDYQLFTAIVNLRTALENERVDLTHGRYGGSQEIKDGVLWMDAFHAVQHTTRINVSGTTEDATEWLREHVFVYELADLETVARNFEDFHSALSQFIGYLGAPDKAWRDERYPQLCAIPVLAKELARMGEAQKEKT